MPRKRRRIGSIIVNGAPVLYILIFYFSALALTIGLSLSKFEMGKASLEFTLENYHSILNVISLGTLGKSIALASLSTIIALLISYPLAYYVAVMGGRWKNMMLTLVVMPFFVSFVIRTFSIMSIISNEGILNQTLLFLGIIREPLRILHTPLAVVIGMTYNYLPLMVLPLYSACEKMDRSLVEAASVLGANKIQVFIEVTLPQTLIGILCGIVLVLIPCIGEFVIPAMLGGSGWYMVGSYVYSLFFKTLNPAAGAAMTVVLLSVTMVFAFIYYKYLAERGGFAI